MDRQPPLEGSLGDPVENLMVACLVLPAGQRQAALEPACSEHPGLAAELRGRWRTLAAAVDASAAFYS